MKETQTHMEQIKGIAEAMTKAHPDKHDGVSPSAETKDNYLIVATIQYFKRREADRMRKGILPKWPTRKGEMTEEEFEEARADFAEQHRKFREAEGCVYCGEKVLKYQDTCNEHLMAYQLERIGDELSSIQTEMSTGFNVNVSIDNEVPFGAFDDIGIDLAKELGVKDFDNLYGDDEEPWDCNACDTPISFGKPYINLSVTEEVMQHANDPITVIGAESLGTWHKKCSPHKAPARCEEGEDWYCETCESPEGKCSCIEKEEKV